MRLFFPSSSMDTKFASSTMAFVLVFGILAFSLGAGNAHAQSNTWYVGEGVRQDTYVTYEIQDFLTNDGTPFQMTIYFQEQDDRGAWIAPVYVVTQGEVLTGTFRLADNNLTPLGGGDVPDRLRPFESGYQNSLTILEGYANKGTPRSLSGNPWGNVAGTGAAVIGPTGAESITVPGGNFDTAVISFRAGVETSRIWVADNFPYPVKALTYATVTSPPAPINYAYELIEYGEGRPEVPEGTENIPVPPLRKNTVTAAHQIEISWEPVEIQIGEETTFTISFFNNAGQPESNVAYDLRITDSNGNVLEEERNVLAAAGTRDHTYTFEEGGGKNIDVIINSVRGAVSPGGFTESADFTIVVVPEFPISAAIIAGAVIGFVALMTRFYRTSFGNMFGGRNTL